MSDGRNSTQNSKQNNAKEERVMYRLWRKKLWKRISWPRLRDFENSMRLRNMNWRYASAPVDIVNPDAQKNVP